MMPRQRRLQTGCSGKRRRRVLWFAEVATVWALVPLIVLCAVPCCTRDRGMTRETPGANPGLPVGGGMHHVSVCNGQAIVGFAPATAQENKDTKTLPVTRAPSPSGIL